MRLKRTICAIIVMLMALSASACFTTGGTPISASLFCLDTVITITVYKESHRKYFDELEAELKRCELIFSRTNESSELFMLNRAGGGTMSDELRDCLTMALHFAEATDGAFDPSIAPLVSLWDFTSETPSVPKEDDLNAALAHVDYRNILVEANVLTLKHGATIDLGAIAKGYIADRLKSYLVEQDVESAILNLGGNVSVIGARPGGTPYNIGIAKPFSQEGEIIKSLELEDTSAVTSGSYQRYFYDGGKLFHHILNPQTGMSAHTGLLSVTVIDECSAKADALSTACFLLGFDAAKELLKTEGVKKAVFVLADYSVTEYNGD